MKNSWLLIALLFLFGCKSEKTQESSLFSQYVGSIESIGLPFSFYSLDKISTPSDSYLKEGFKKYKLDWSTQPYGKAFVAESFVAIIETWPGDVIVPVVATYNWNGGKIDSLNLYSGGGIDMGYKATVLATLHPDYSISITDSIRKWELNEEGDDIIPGSDKLTLKKNLYIIDQDGKFIKQ